jgi:hypothetical protein
MVGGFAVGVVLGFLGNWIEEGPTQSLLYAVSSVGLVAASVLAAVRAIPRGEDLLASGFATFALAEAVLWATGGPGAGSEASFATGAMFYVPALLLLALAGSLPLWSRLAGAIATVPFGAHAVRFIAGHDVTSEGALAAAGYTLLTVAALGWIWWALRTEGADAPPRAANR